MTLGGTEAVLISAGLNLVGGLFGKSSANKQKKAEEAFLKKKYNEYDLPLWEMQKEKLVADRDELIRSIKLKQANELKLADFKDKNNLRNYQQSLKIRDFEIEQQQRLFNKSEGLYAEAVRSGYEQANVQMFETKQQYAFQNESNIIESIQKKGELAVKSQAGKNLVKAAQSQLADEGRQMAIMTESIVSADRSTRMQLRQHLIKSHAQRMLKPQAPPMPLEPLKTPVADYEMPRALQDFDFGPKPIKGVSTTQVPSMLGVIANAAASGFSAYAAQTAGTSSFGKSTNTNNFGSINYSAGDFNTPSSIQTGIYNA